MKNDNLQLEIKLDKKLSKFLVGYINERFQFMSYGTIEQKKDLLAFIIYLIANQPFNCFQIVRANVLHDIKGILKNDKYFSPRSFGYSKKISITNL